MDNQGARKVTNMAEKISGKNLHPSWVQHFAGIDIHNLWSNKNSNALLSDPETRISFIFARRRSTQSRCGAARVGTVVCHTAAADTVLGNMVINN